MTTDADSTGQPGPPSAGPVFVVGSMRSGSTMLRLILDSHRHIAIGPETGFMAAVRGTKEIPSWKYGKNWFERVGWSEQEFDARVRDFYGGMFERFATAQGKRRWGEKTPFHTSHMDEMARIFPDAVFVGIVRHPGAVAASLRRRFHYTFEDALAYWTDTNLELIRNGVALGGRFNLCRYEDLLLEGEPVLRELLACLGEPWDPAVLEHHRVQREKGAPRAVEGSTVTHDPIDASRAVQWEQSATEQDHAALRATAPLAAFLGYDALNAADREPIVPAGGPRRWMASGDDLSVRQRAWEPRVDFRQQAVAPVIDADPEELARRLAHTERALARVRSRRSVRMGDAVRKVQHGRSLADLRDAFALVRGASDPRH